jgi:hypothetical protein
MQTFVFSAECHIVTPKLQSDYFEFVYEVNANVCTLSDTPIGSNL